ncbi:hypothetical protein UlMin_011369 [Ulmus minor]
MLSLLIPGPQSPGKDMDVFLRPLIDELKELWVHGLDTHDAASENGVFRMRAALLWTVNDFPARSSLSGWSGQGYRACPTCNEDTPSMQVIGKTAYFGHRHFLPTNHHWRSNLQRDLEKLGIRHELHLFEDGNKLMKPTADYTFSEANRRKFCRFIRSVKFPDGFASNLSKNVAQNDSRLLGLKSHDCHVIMQRLLPVGCRSLVNKNIWSTIVELCTFFNQLCASTVNVSDMVEAQNQLVLILCKLERIFPPAFFELMIHLVLHLPEEAILGGPVHMRWMYPFERYLKRLKDYVRNAAKPEGSIAEGYVVDEALTFCSRYFDDVETRFNRPDRNDDGIHPTRQLSVFESQCKPLGKQSYVEMQAPEVTTELLSLYSKTNMVVSSYPACIVNGVRFVTHDRDVRLRTQNSGVSVPGTGQEMFYGQLQQILEFSYLNGFSVVLFRCKWFKCDSKHMVTENKITSIDINGEAYKDDQFILASQAKHVFYVADPSRGPNWRVVQHVKHRSIWDITDDGLSDIDLLQHNSSSNFTLFVDLGNLQEINLLRRDQDVIPIVQPVTNASRPVTDDSSFLNDANEVELSDEEDESVEECADEETDAETEIDTEEDDDDPLFIQSESSRQELHTCRVYHTNYVSYKAQ